MIPDFGVEADAAVKAACAEFPGEFGLRAFPGDTFRVSESASHVSRGRVFIYTQRLWDRERFLRYEGREPRSDAELWRDFGKGYAEELRREIVRK